VINKGVGEEPRALSTSEVKELTEKFISAALRCKAAGFDGVELHGAHGYIIDQFMSPHTNLRTDEYGGTFENRMRFVTEIIHGIKAKCGENFPVMVRFSADEFIDGGIDLELGKKIAGHLEKEGADALDVSCGTYESMLNLLEPVFYDQGWRVYLAEAVKSVVKIPVATVGVIRQPQFAESVIAEGRADFVDIGRDFLTDPEWASKAEAGLDKEIRQCIACLYCVNRIFSGNHIACAVNARAGRELEFGEFLKDGGGRRVAVIGGGPGGMEAARVLALRGFRPVVYEKQNELGGQLIPGCRPPKKDKIRWYKEYLESELMKYNVTVHLGTEATPEMVGKENPYAVVVAIGGEWIQPPLVSDIPSRKLTTSEKVLLGSYNIKPGEKAVILGGGLTGCETADLLAQDGVDVTVIEMRDEIAPTSDNLNRSAMKIRLDRAGVQVMTGTKYSGFSDGDLEVENVKTGQKKTIPADHVILALGLEAPVEKVERWKQAFDRVTVIGDAVKPRMVANAVREGFDAAFTLSIEKFTPVEQDVTVKVF
jgi:NADPH-dependent 2,4-dienoyl-CoA reductase/sulfur reductase-like enzyme